MLNSNLGVFPTVDTCDVYDIFTHYLSSTAMTFASFANHHVASGILIIGLLTFTSKALHNCTRNYEIHEWR